MRESGILLPIFSLPSKYGIGGFSKEAYEFVDFLKKADQKLWQILPIGPTGYGDSPYQSFSTFAGNPYMIDVDEFAKRGWITQDNLSDYSCETEGDIDYEALYHKRNALLRIAFENSDISKDSEYQAFCKENAFWLDDYALFMTIKDLQGGKAWAEWDRGLRVREEALLDKYRKEYAHESDFYRFVQFFFRQQWMELKKYANEAGVQIVGDIPIYVAFDSSDVWGNPELFDLDEENIPNAVAGCPPDYFAATGQLWGNPLYKWDYHKETGFDWWVKRMAHCFAMYDVVRIDHFRGFDEFYSIPYGMPTAEIGEWLPGPGYELFKTFNEKLGNKRIIAEDLGLITDTVKELVAKTGYPGMKVLQFAFGGDNKNEYLPHMVTKNSVIYTGTHDNETTRGWYERCLAEDVNTAKYLEEYTGENDSSKMAATLVRMAYASVCDTAIIPMQDFLNLGKEARINTPSVLGGNWCWRMKNGDASDELAKEIKELVRIYNR